MKNISLFVTLILSLLLLPTAYAHEALQQDAAVQEKSGNKKTKASKNDNKEKKDDGKFLGIIPKKKSDEDKLAEQMEKYQELREKAWTKYKDSSKAEFKFRVDADYKEKRREHSEYAFHINTFDANDERTTYTGDKLKTEDTLYDNQLVQDYVNRVGQSLVPVTSRNRYAIKVILNPVPDARSMSTGTVYITTGLLSLIDNEAQLAYILGHEIAHVENNHWFEDALVLNELVDRQRQRDSAFKWIGIGMAALTGGLSMARGEPMYYSLFTAGASGYGIYALLKFVGSVKTFNWDKVQEDDADRDGMKYMFDRNYDPREVPKLYARLKNLSDREPGVSDGFLARAERINERIGYVNPLMGGWMVAPLMVRGSVNLRGARTNDPDDKALTSPLEPGKPFGQAEDAEKREKTAGNYLTTLDERLREKLAKGEILGSGPEFEIVMADLKRDNGVRAFYYDMFSMALQNLEEAQQIRSDDPYTAFYYGKVLQLTARTPAEKARAMQSFANAISLDKRGVLPGPRLHRALGLMGDRNPSQFDTITTYLKRYVEIYQQEHSGALPENIDAIYAYLKALGDETWVARPVQNVSTKNIDPLETTPVRTAAPPRATQPDPAPNPPVTNQPAPRGGRPRKP